MFPIKRLNLILIFSSLVISAGENAYCAAAIENKYKQKAAAGQLQQEQMVAYQEQMMRQGTPVPVAGAQNPSTPPTQLAQTQSIRNFIYPKTNLLSQGNNASGSAAQEVDMEQIWKELEVSSEVWMYMIDVNPKEIVIQRYIDWYKKQGVNIRRSASTYVGTIDSMAQQNPDLLKNAFKDVLMFAAVLEYDFDNGQDRDELARRVLGESLYQQNRKRLGL